MSDVPALRIILVGDGPERPAIEALVAQLDLGDRIEFRGYVADPSVVFAEADLFVLPSGAEACPLALLQAMSSGLPVVASRVGGIPDVVRTGVEGLLVDAADSAGLTAALQTLTSDPEARQTMGTHARQRITSAYSLKICVDKLLEIYRP